MIEEAKDADPQVLAAREGLDDAQGGGRHVAAQDFERSLPDDPKVAEAQKAFDEARVAVRARRAGAGRRRGQGRRRAAGAAEPRRRTPTTRRRALAAVEDDIERLGRDLDAAGAAPASADADA